MGGLRIEHPNDARRANVEPTNAQPNYIFRAAKDKVFKMEWPGCGAKVGLRTKS